MRELFKHCETIEDYKKVIDDKSVEIVKSLNGFTYDEVYSVTEKVRNIMKSIPLEVPND